METTEEKKTSEEKYIREQLKALRKGEYRKCEALKGGVTQTVFAKMVGKSKDTISKWERGEWKLSYKHIIEICKIFGIPDSYFYKTQSVDQSPPVQTMQQTPDQHSINLSSHMRAREKERTRLHEDNSRKLQDKLFSEYIMDFIHLGNLEQHSHEELRKMTEEYIKKIKDISYALPSNTQILVYSTAQRDFLKNDYARIALTGEEISPLLNAIVLGIKGKRSRESQDEYWDEEFKHLQNQFTVCVENLIKSNMVSTLFVCALAPQPLVVELGRLLTKISNVEILNPYRINNFEVNWGWRQSDDELEFRCHEAKTIHDDAVLNISLNTLIKKSVIERAIGQKDLSIWTLTIEEPDNECLKSKIQLDDFKKKFLYMLDEILKKHGKRSYLHVFLSVPIPIAFEIGRLWRPDSDPSLKLYGLSGESGNYYLIHTISKD